MIKIPKKLIKKLDGQLGTATTAIDGFIKWFGASGFPFFEEWTDHGPKHIEEVLRTASALVTKQSWKHLTEEDALVLVLATVAHDSAMAFEKDQFLALAKGDWSPDLIEGFDTKTWEELWDDYLWEVKRYSGKQLEDITGSSEQLTIDLNRETWTERELRIIGDFLRKHHPRLAHEISVYGTPPVKGKSISFSQVDDDYRDIAGLVARSHGLPLRSCYDHLKKKYNHKISPRKTHPIYLMTLLRIADYLQIESERAEPTMLKVRNIMSPLSDVEWQMHHAIKDTVTDENDPECIRIDCRPKDAKTYLRLRQLLDGLQKELDESWASLGEIYGQNRPLKSLGLNLRRARSNLDDLSSFSDEAKFLPVHAKFKTADTPLLALLIDPLYGDVPSVGVRELVQNSVDAVLELRSSSRYQATLPLTGVDQSQQIDILLQVETRQDGYEWLIIQDNGIGMSIDTVLNYFLKVGASFRTDPTWMQEFEDQDQTPKIARSGRFGIGVLAAFLLGPELIVTTRHASEDRGVRFRAKLDTDPIDILETDCTIGTTIEVRITAENIFDSKERFRLSHHAPMNSKNMIADFSWYKGISPVVGFVHNGKPIPIVGVVPSPDDAANGHGWRRIEARECDFLDWKTDSISSGFCVNGFAVKDPRRSSYNWENSLSLPSNDAWFRIPTVSAYDSKSQIPLTLQRYGLSRPWKAMIDLENSISCDFIANLLVNTPASPDLGEILQLDKLLKRQYFRHGSFELGRKWVDDFAREDEEDETTLTVMSLGANRKGLTVITPWINTHSSFTTMFLMISDYADKSDFVSKASLPITLSDSYLLTLASLSSNLGSEVLSMLHDDINTLEYIPCLKRFQILRCAASISWDKGIFNSGPKASRSGYDQDVRHIMSSFHQPSQFGGCFVLDLDRSSIIRTSNLQESWSRLLGQALIPFDPDERREEFKNAYIELDYYIKLHEKEKKIRDGQT